MGDHWSEKWETDAEIDFLEHLGEHSTCSTPRILLLRGYRAGLRLRKTWEGLDKSDIFDAVNAMIKAES